MHHREQDRHQHPSCVGPDAPRRFHPSDRVEAAQTLLRLWRVARRLGLDTATNAIGQEGGQRDRSDGL